MRRRIALMVSMASVGGDETVVSAFELDPPMTAAASRRSWSRQTAPNPAYTAPRRLMVGVSRRLEITEGDDTSSYHQSSNAAAFTPTFHASSGTSSNPPGCANAGPDDAPATAAGAVLRDKHSNELTKGRYLHAPDLRSARSIQPTTDPSD